MAYAQEATANVPTQSLLDDSGRLIDRLSEIYGRLVKLGDALHGSQPRDAGAPPPGKVEPAVTVRRNLDKMQNWMGDIEGELHRIESRL